MHLTHCLTARKRLIPVVKSLLAGSLLASLAIPAALAAQPAGNPAFQRQSARNMRLVGMNDLQGRSAYQPLIHYQNGHYIAYIGHHAGRALNPLTGRVEDNGTSIVDVTHPRHPVYLHHIPGPAHGGAQMVRVCDGDQLPHGQHGRTYLLRPRGNAAHEIWDVTHPSNPSLLTTVVAGLKGTHKSEWECATGIAYLNSDGRPDGWRSNRITKIYDLSDPAHPVFIRDFGLPGQEPGSTGPVPEGEHGMIVHGNRVYFAYGTSNDGAVQIVDRDKLLNGPKAPTVANLLAPQVGFMKMQPDWGAHTTFPVMGINVPEFARFKEGRKLNFLVVPSEQNKNDCQGHAHLTFMVDITDEHVPFSVANFQVPEASGHFCERGGRFGPHATNESFSPIYYGRMVFLTYFNAGVRAIDIRDPFHPQEAGYFIPAVNRNTKPTCGKRNGQPDCKVVIQTNNVEVDDRGLIYIVDRAGTGMHILELTGPARKIADYHAAVRYAEQHR